MSVALPFRAEHVGSLLRPDALKEARRRFAAGALDRDGLTAVEDREIMRVIEKQEALGLPAVTDGEFRRAWWHLDFLEGLSGVEKYRMEGGMAFSGVSTKSEGVQVTGPVACADHPMVGHFKFLASHTSNIAKQCIPAPSALYGRRGRDAVDASIYPSLDNFWSDLGEAYRRAVNSFVQAGCKYIQLDEVFLTMFCDEAYRQKIKDQGDSPDELARTYADLINIAISDVPEDVVTAIHLCRGNFRSTFLGSGSYDLIASIIFERIKVRGYFMEYDTDRAGGFEPLERMPSDRRAVLGIISSKFGQQESRGTIQGRIEEAAGFAALDQLALSPQCGFASTEEGNLLAEDEQWAKLETVVELTQKIWGRQ